MKRTRTIQSVLISSLALIAIIARLKFNGLFLNFDYGIYQPDGSHYAYRSLVFLGVSPDTAANKIVDWYAVHGYKNNLFSAELLSPDNASTWGLVAPRILYPLLSLPFVLFLGIPGMLVIPILSFLLLVFVTYKISDKCGNRWTGVGLVLVITTSPTVLRWMISNITDSLLAALFALVVLVIMRSSYGWSWHVSVLSLVVMTSLTRFCLPIWLAISLVYWLNRMRIQSLVIFLSSIVAFIPTLIYMPSNALLPAEGGVGGYAKIVLLGESFIKIGFIEVAQLAALDRTLLLFLFAAFAISLRYRNELSSQMFLAVVFAVWTIGAINGTMGVNFRYQLPVLGFASWVVISNLIPFANWIGGRGINIIGKEA